jgi:hypothetical protein
VEDQNVEVAAWEERVSYKRSTLSKPWKLPPAILSKHHNPKPTKNHSTTSLPPSPVKKTKIDLIKTDFMSLPKQAHSIRNLKLLLLSHINSLQRFTPTELLSLEYIHDAAQCVAQNDIPKDITERDVTNILLAALNLLLRDGNIINPQSRPQVNEFIKAEILPATEEETFIVVGSWNLGSTVKSVAKKDGRVNVRDLWTKIMSWGSGWEGTTKGVIGVVVEEVLLGIEGQEWIESKPGLWTRLDL